ncbi:MAG: hypothetical protein M3Y60_05770, partial [Bacteroidota bacterium]|nr:hypothetical protein [Bacteroidota bacterium]
SWALTPTLEKNMKRLSGREPLSRIQCGSMAFPFAVILGSKKPAPIETQKAELPCSCGGVLNSLGWKAHLVFNIVFTLLSIVGIMLMAQPTRIIFADDDRYALSGFTENGDPHTYFDEIYEMNVTWYSDRVDFVGKLKVSDPTMQLKGVIEYMVCSSDLCIPDQIPIVADVDLTRENLNLQARTDQFRIHRRLQHHWPAHPQYAPTRYWGISTKVSSFPQNLAIKYYF